MKKVWLIVNDRTVDMYDSHTGVKIMDWRDFDNYWPLNEARKFAQECGWYITHEEVPLF